MAEDSQPRTRGRSSDRDKSDGPAFFDDILNMAGSLASSRKEYAAAQLENVADSVRQFTDAMPEIPTMKAYAEAAADSLEDLATYVTESDLSEIVADAREFTHRHPLMTLGGSIVAGLVITQMVQARTSAMRASRRSSQRSAQRARKTRSASRNRMSAEEAAADRQE